MKTADFLTPNSVLQGDASVLMNELRPATIALSFWSPPYFVGKEYEKHLTFETWQALLRNTIIAHGAALKPGAFLVINIADILCFPDRKMPRLQAPNVSKHRSPVTREDVLKARMENPELNRYELAELLGCSEQTIDRRINGNNIRGGKYAAQTRVQLVGHFLVDYAQSAGLFLYDRRVWVKDPCWQNCQWHSSSYRSVDEFEYLYFFWKPGETKIDRNRLNPQEWAEWGSRAVWSIPSVRSNCEHEAQFPVELPRRVIRLLTEPKEIVLDPFIGSGSTAVAAIEEDRQFIGFDEQAKYVALAKRRIRRALADRSERLF